MDVFHSARNHPQSVGHGESKMAEKEVSEFEKKRRGSVENGLTKSSSTGLSAVATTIQKVGVERQNGYVPEQ